MKRYLSAMLALAMVLALTACAAPAAEPDPEPDPEPSSISEPEPVPEPATVEGVVKETSPDKIVIQLADGSTLALDATGVTDLDVAPGDTVKVEYTGEIGSMAAAGVEVTARAEVTTGSFTGVVMSLSDELVILALDNGTTLFVGPEALEKVDAHEGDTIVFEYTKTGDNMNAIPVEVIPAQQPAQEAPANTGGSGSSSGSTNPADYDASNPAVAAALKMVGQKRKCTEIAEAAAQTKGKTGWVTHGSYNILEPEGYLGIGTIVSADQMQPGDILYYADGGLGFSHVGVYIGDGMAVHGNFTSDGITKIASAYYTTLTSVIHID